MRSAALFAPARRSDFSSVSYRGEHEITSDKNEIKNSIIERINYSIELAKREYKKFEDEEFSAEIKKQVIDFEDKALGFLKKCIDTWDREPSFNSPHNRKEYIKNEINKLMSSYLQSAPIIEEKDDEKKDNGHYIKIKKELDYLAIKKDPRYVAALGKPLNEIAKKFFDLPLTELSKTNKKWLKMTGNVEKYLATKKKRILSKNVIKKANLQQKILNLLFFKNNLLKLNFAQFINRFEFFKSLEQQEYKDPHGNNALHFCAWFDDHELAEQLSPLVDKTKSNHNHYLPFHFVIQRKGFNTKALLTALVPSYKDLVSLDPQSRTSLESAAYYGNHSALKWIIDYLKNHDEKMETQSWMNVLKKSLNLACEQNNEKVVEILCKELIDADIPVSELQKFCFKVVKSGQEKLSLVFFQHGILSTDLLHRNIDNLTPKEAGNAARCMRVIAEKNLTLLKQLETLSQGPVEQKRVYALENKSRRFSR